MPLPLTGNHFARNRTGHDFCFPDPAGRTASCRAAGAVALPDSRQAAHPGVSRLPILDATATQQHAQAAVAASPVDALAHRPARLALPCPGTPSMVFPSY